MFKSFYRNSEFTRFILVGGLAAFVNFVSRILLNTTYSFRVSVVLAYIIGMITAFILSKYIVFSPSGNHPLKEFIYFSLVNIVAIIQVWIISVALAENLFPAINFSFFADEIAHFIGISFPILTSYFGHKYFSFRK